jgi:hypothetical protein
MPSIKRIFIYLLVSFIVFNISNLFLYFGINLSSIAFSFLNNIPFMNDTVNILGPLKVFLTIVISESLLDIPSPTMQMSANPPSTAGSDGSSSSNTESSGGSSPESEYGEVSTEDLKIMYTEAVIHEFNCFEEAKAKAAVLDTRKEEVSTGANTVEALKKAKLESDKADLDLEVAIHDRKARFKDVMKSRDEDE